MHLGPVPFMTITLMVYVSDGCVRWGAHVRNARLVYLIDQAPDATINGVAALVVIFGPF